MKTNPVGKSRVLKAKLTKKSNISERRQLEDSSDDETIDTPVKKKGRNVPPTQFSTPARILSARPSTSLGTPRSNTPARGFGLINVLRGGTFENSPGTPAEMTETDELTDETSEN